MTIPQEILEEILDHLRFDFHTLKACSLTHSSFLPPSHRLLFMTVKIRHYRHQVDSCLKFRDTMVASKYMASSVCYLILHYLYQRPEEQPDECMLFFLLRLLPKLQLVKIYHSLSKATMHNIDSLRPPPSISNIRHLILTDTKFESFTHLFSLFSSLEQLDTITMFQVTVKDVSSPNHLAPSRRCHPSALDLYLGDPIVEHLFSPQSTISLKGLRVLNIVATNAVYLPSFVIPSLESLTLRLTKWKCPAGNPIDLRQLRRLRNISIRLRFYNSCCLVEVGQRWPSPLGHRFFETLPSSVEDIYIEVVISSFVPELLPKYRSDWQELDHILARHPLLFTVRFGIYIDRYYSDLGEEDSFDYQWSDYGSMDDYLPDFMRFECMPEMNRLGRVDCKLVKSRMIFSPYVDIFEG
ncbi:hypothetical protein ARMSODRAFT_955634 [Armillaria solidipes]|uniref:F-box domain-containing protein n=1 Tax=Armillaria solidipes TaxID=1076256 RepID=A0A2H3C6I8_9AGAR|nr:hypothetical protein ARMSODRAFT_955634 [Armillaria solidipes]